ATPRATIPPASDIRQTIATATGTLDANGTRISARIENATPATTRMDLTSKRGGSCTVAIIRTLSSARLHASLDVSDWTSRARPVPFNVRVVPAKTLKSPV